MSDEHGFKDHMDFVPVTAKPYPCGLCNRVHAPSGVLRLTDIKPDFPPDAPRVDVLMCENALDHAHFLMWAASVDATPEAQARRIDYSPAELAALDAEREEEEFRRFNPGLTD